MHFEGLVAYYDPSNRNREYGEAKAFAHIQWLIERAQNNPESASALYYYDDEKDEDMYRLTNLTESDLYKESFKMSSTASALEKLSGKGAGRGAGNAKGVGRGQSLGGATALGGDVTLPPGDLSPEATKAAVAAAVKDLNEVTNASSKNIQQLNKFKKLIVSHLHHTLFASTL